ILVETDLANAEHVGPVQKFRNDGQHFLCQFDILRLLRVDAEPGKMRQAEFGGSLWLMLRELAKIIVKPMHRTPIKSRPKRRLAHGLTARRDHVEIIVSDAANHVSMRFD